MKKVVNIARIIFWTASLVFLVTFVTIEILVKRDAAQFTNDVTAMLDRSNSNAPTEATLDLRPILKYIVFMSGGLMFFAFTVLEMSSIPSPKIKPERLYTLEKIISHNYKDHTVVLSYGNDVEIFRCRYVTPIVALPIGNEYTVQRIDGNLFFHPNKQKTKK